jgi:serine-type D-Ala-D-Ala carboxypeptidase/endopeptidase (penicillin-binding protein 4)
VSQFRLNWLILFCIFFYGIGCRAKKQIVRTDNVVIVDDGILTPNHKIIPNPEQHKLPIISLAVYINNLIDTSTILNSGWTGLTIYSLDNDSLLYDRSGSKYFTSASNVKLLTTYACLKVLGDSIPALKYIETDTSLTFWGTGDPTLLNSKFESPRVWGFLKEKAKTKRLYYYSKTIDAHYGEGWMWDDYNGGYQPEISALPMYENMVTFCYTKDSSLCMLPSIFTSRWIENRDFHIKRSRTANVFDVSKSIENLDHYVQHIPIHDVNSFATTLLNDTLKIPIVTTYSYPSTYIKPQILYSIPKDTVISKMMAESDNFLAEHLLLTCGSTISDSLSTVFVIDTLLNGLMSHINPKPKWADGSGLSRYNLQTPHASIQMLREMYIEYGEKRIFNLMSIGGNRGTLKNLYNDKATPYIFAKTGTLSGVYNLSGYMITASGQRLAFSMMNNNFSGPSSKVRIDVQRILKEVYIRL